MSILYSTSIKQPTGLYLGATFQSPEGDHLIEVRLYIALGLETKQAKLTAQKLENFDFGYSHSKVHTKKPWNFGI